MNMPNASPPSFAEMTDSQKMLLLSMSMNGLNMDVGRFKKILIEGDGDDLPLPERIRNLEKFTGTMQFWFRTIAMALIVQTVTFGAAAILYFVRLYPLIEGLSRQIP